MVWKWTVIVSLRLQEVVNLKLDRIHQIYYPLMFLLLFPLHNDITSWRRSVRKWLLLVKGTLHKADTIQNDIDDTEKTYFD